MTYYVYKHKSNRARYPFNWELKSTHATYEEANAAARKLCGRIRKIYIESGHGMREAFFGGHDMDEPWRAMIDTKDIFEGREK